MKSNLPIYSFSSCELGRFILIALTYLTISVLLLLPLVSVLGEAFAKGVDVYLKVFKERDTQSALLLTIISACVSVPLNVVFGVAAAWLVTKFRFPGRKLLLSLIDLPLSISPVVAGLIFVLLFGSRGWFGNMLSAWDIKVIFAVPGIIIATTFVTLPYVARELIPLMEAQGLESEEAALTLGASGWQTFWLVSLPRLRWGLLYGVILCNARAMGEFGAVSVVSGHIRGETNTLPLHIEILYNEYNFVGAFSVASLLTLLAVLTILIKTVLENTAMARGQR